MGKHRGAELAAVPISLLFIRITGCPTGTTGTVWV
ncbi:protein of unknown function [Candidatus Methylomirabilis oxygeniifera]|uniref:Uncharacterized protein n=1 Tax=Methylomirabilis oxygeniifera TaxID=671143 RepID=D5MGV5_METO1|nr:protein of unknown function [Candidatus Methylomirabilis oxyfera]